MDEKRIQRIFKRLYGKKARLLAVQLNGFTHRVIFNHGKGTKIITEDFSAYVPEANWPVRAKLFLSLFPPHQFYQNNPVEILYITPNDA